MQERPLPPKIVLMSTTHWAIVLCLLGACAIFLPWAETLTYHGYLQDGIIQVKGTPSRDWVYGSRLWHGYATTYAFFGLFLFLFVTSPIKPNPLWRSIVLLLAAVGILLLMVVGREWNHAPTLGDAPQDGTWMTYSWAIGSYVPIASAVALALVASVEIRGKIVMSLSRSHHGAEAPKCD
jgi:hypothetical protein